MKIEEVAFIGYPVTDLGRARNFYEETLGLTLARDYMEGEDISWLEYDLGPVTFAITNMVPDWKASGQGGSMALEVENFETAISELKAAETEFKMEPFESPVCHMAVILDPDGNALTIHKRKPDRPE